jgi:iron complex outermembrane receptor protein
MSKKHNGDTRLSPLFAIAGLGAMGIAGPTLAQEKTGAEASSEVATLQEVVITAERRAQKLQDTNLAVQVVSGEELQNKGVTKLNDLQYATPSLTISDGGFSQNASIRGVGLAITSYNVVPGVPIYRDGLAFTSSVGLSEPYFDIAQVEVLRGPQGTFVGQSSTGGAIFVNSKTPVVGGEASGDVMLQAGSYGNIRLTGAQNLPISDTMAARVAFSSERRDSFYTTISPDPSLHANTMEPGRIQNFTGRVGLKWQPDSDTSVLWMTTLMNHVTDGTPFKPLPGTSLASQAPTDPYSLDYNSSTRSNESFGRSGVDIEHRFSNDYVVKATGGGQYNSERQVQDFDGSKVLGTEFRLTTFQRVASLDVTLLSPEHDRFHWLVGETYSRLKIEGGPYFVTTPIVTHIDLKLVENGTLGVFGQGTFELTPDLELQGAMRYTHDDFKLRGNVVLAFPGPGGALFPGPVIPFNNSASDSVTTGKAALNWKVSPNSLLYGFWASGQKAGGGSIDGSTFDPERVQDYELGWKTTQLDGHLRGQVNGYYMKYQDFQYSTIDPVTTGNAVRNVGAATIYGAEFQAQYRQGGFEADAAAAYNHSKIGSLRLVDALLLPNGTANGLGPQCPPGTASNSPICFDYNPTIVDVSGSKNPFSPNWTFNASLGYNFMVGKGDLTPSVSVSYLSSQWSTIIQRRSDPGALIPARTLVNLLLTYNSGPWSVQGYVTNLSDVIYKGGVTYPTFVYGAPRQGGIRISRSF